MRKTIATLALGAALALGATWLPSLVTEAEAGDPSCLHLASISDSEAFQRNVSARYDAGYKNIHYSVGTYFQSNGTADPLLTALVCK